MAKKRLFFRFFAGFQPLAPGWHGRCNTTRERNSAFVNQPRPEEEIMKFQKLIAAAAVFAATASAYAQQTEFVAPDAGAKSTLTRAEVRHEIGVAYRNHTLVQQQHTGQDPVYAKSQRSRGEVRAEAAEAARQSRAVDVTSPYFG
jgi:hypothetical protein